MVAFNLTIRERNHSWSRCSPAHTVHPTRDEAYAALLEYVKRNWETKMGTDPSSDPEQMIEEYLAEVLETYDIQESA